MSIRLYGRGMFNAYSVGFEMHDGHLRCIMIEIELAFTLATEIGNWFAV